MSGERTLRLRPPPAKVQAKSRPVSLLPVDPAKLALAQQLGLRFISRKERYILQAKTFVRYEAEGPLEHTWIDIPLLPEAYGP